MFYGKMMSICRRYTRNEDQAKDILQDAFIKVFSKVAKFNFEGSFEGWVRRIVVNTAIDFTRKAKNDYLLMNENQSIEDFENDLLEIEEEEFNIPLNVGDVINGMNKLSNAYRTVFNLYVFENYSHQEIADALGISVGTSKSNLAKARANLKKLLKIELDKRHGEST
jgi:RNA polymerase sigma-70 factor (ECF subfamily)